MDSKNTEVELYQRGYLIGVQRQLTERFMFSQEKPVMRPRLFEVNPQSPLELEWTAPDRFYYFVLRDNLESPNRAIQIGALLTGHLVADFRERKFAFYSTYDWQPYNAWLAEKDQIFICASYDQFLASIKEAVLSFNVMLPDVPLDHLMNQAWVYYTAGPMVQQKSE